MFSTFSACVAVVFMTITLVNAETHTISFDNQCGYGTPQLLYGGNVVSNGEDYTVQTDFAGIAYLQTGGCGLNGEGCTLLEYNLVNPTQPGGGSSCDISLIPPHAFNVPAAFTYQGGCDGTGASCNDAHCGSAFFVPDDTQVQVACQSNNVNLVITFCGNGAPASPPGGNSPPVVAAPPSPSVTPTPTATQSSFSDAPVSTSSPVINVAPSPVLAATTTSASLTSASAAPSCKVRTPSRRRSQMKRSSDYLRFHRRRMSNLSH